MRADPSPPPPPPYLPTLPYPTPFPPQVKVRSSSLLFDRDSAFITSQYPCSVSKSVNMHTSHTRITRGASSIMALDEGTERGFEGSYAIIILPICRLRAVIQPVFSAVGTD